MRMCYNPFQSSLAKCSDRMSMLLQTKFHLPITRTSLVVRPHLLEKLQAGQPGKVTLVSAPAGFGKTTLVAEWLRSADENTAVAWLSLDPSDNDPTQFFAYLVGGVQKAMGQVGHPQPSLQSPNRPELKTILIALLNELSSQRRTLRLALDDYHLIDNPAIHDALAFLIEQMPPQLHLVLITRADPPLPLARLRVRHQINEIRTVDLRFSPSEVATFLNQIKGIHVTESQATALEARTEGWVASLQLAALSLQHEQNIDRFIAAFSGGHRQVLDYLTEEALQHQSPEVRSFLLKTSVLERLSAPLCDLLTGRSDSQTMLTRLEQSNLFLIPLDEHRQWYRYHHLFADLLRQLLRNEFGDTTVTQLHSQAAHWFAEQEQMEEAIHHALAGKDYALAADLIEAEDLPAENKGKIYSLAYWYRALPETVLRQRPKLTIRYAHKSMMIASMDDTEVILNSPWLAELTDQELQGEITLLRGYIALERLQHQQALTYAQSAQALLTTTNDFWGGTYGLQGHVYFQQGKLDSAEIAYQRAALLDEKAGRISGTIGWLIGLAKIYQAQHRFGEEEETFQHCLKLLAGTQWPSEGDLYVRLAWSQGLRGEFAMAETHLRTGIAIFQRIGEHGGVRDGLLELAYLKRVQQDLPAALALWQEAQMFPAAPEHLWGNIRSELTAVELAWAAGNLEPMRYWLQSTPDWKEQWPVDYKATWCQYQIFLALSQPVSALPAQILRDLAELRADAESRNNLPIRILALVWYALAEAALGHDDQAFHHLQSALDLAAPFSYQLYFLEHGQPMRALIQRAVTNGLKSDFAEVILRTFAEFEQRAEQRTTPTIDGTNAIATSTQGSSNLIEPLTEREQEVLALVVAGLTNQEIAERLVVSIATVKRHISNLYGKMGVTHRTQAIARASELHLV